MLLKSKVSRITKCLSKPQSLVLLLLPCLLVLTLFYVSSYEFDYNFLHNRFQYFTVENYTTSTELDGEYLIYNPKCHMLSINALDPSITKFVKKEKFQTCSADPLLTSIVKEPDGKVYVVVNSKAATKYKNLVCCWAPIERAPINKSLLLEDEEFDSKVSLGKCENFKAKAIIPASIEVIQVSCTNSKVPKKGSNTVYKNVHAIINPKKVISKSGSSNFSNFNGSTTSKPEKNQPKKLSVLMLGIDSVSRLNFHRSMTKTKEYFDKNGWLELNGYNKMGDNTFPNLMAFLTGQDSSTTDSKCRPRSAYGLDKCPFIWYKYRDAGYVTAYGEDHSSISTFNYKKVGFVDPPVDYYLRPYVVATEKYLKSRNYFSTKYCVGPESSVDRIFDCAVDFAKTFVDRPSFGFFWTNAVSHNDMNGPSSYDARFLAKLKDMENAGVMNDSMVIVLSDHGMRYGEIRHTFVGWYEERLPFIYIRLPEWFREQDPAVHHALQVNQNRLTSPYDLYETLRDIVQRSGVQAVPSSGCPYCNSLFKPAPYERGCKDAGVAPHWCTCSAFEPLENVNGTVVQRGAEKFIDHIENLVKVYKSKKGKRLCSKLKLKKITSVKKIIKLDEETDKVLELFYYLELSPGDMKFEVTIEYHGGDNYTILDDQVSRVNVYAYSARCLEKGHKQYCHCTK